MPSTPDELKAARSWIGSTSAESDAVFDERYDRLGSLDAAITESIRSQISVLVEDPSDIRLPSGLAVRTNENIKQLERRLEDFLAIGGVEGSGANVSRLLRTDPR